MSNINYQQLRERYKPEKVRILFVAEAPPENTERFFYYEDVPTQDALFVNLIRVLYPELDRKGGVNEIRKQKPQLLERFKNDGYYLIDALESPMSLKLTPKQRNKLINDRKSALAKEIKQIIGSGPFNPEAPESGIVLIKATVYDALADYLLLDEHLPVLNVMLKVPFPSHGNAKLFHDKLGHILRIFDKRYRHALPKPVA
ncbi:hypothetical protein KY386_03090 [Candidatus Parcubacteria bacterium]|nr:hypothetical protein [Candidatus Parcubacteria bacterium]